MAWNIGANDVANAIGTSVGSGALTLSKAVIIAAVFEFVGALLVGSHVSETVQKGIIRLDMFADTPIDVVYGMIAALLAAGAWLQIASYFGWPVSTTHSIVGAVLGFGWLQGGVEAVYWGKITHIVASWLLSPLMGAVLAYLTFSFLRRQIFYSLHPTQAAKRLTPILVFCCITLLSMVGLIKGLHHLNLHLSPSEGGAISASLGAIAACISWFWTRNIPEVSLPQGEARLQDPQIFYSMAKLRKHLGKIEGSTSGSLQEKASTLLHEVKELEEQARHQESQQSAASEFASVEKIFAALQVISACFMAFAHGANDVANAIGPLAGAIAILFSNDVSVSTPIPIWILAMGGLGIVTGLATWGWRVIDTIGKKITELTPSRGFSAEFGASTTILLASKLGLPISTTHTLVGAVLGVGLARGIGAINLFLIRDIVLSWVITLPAGSLMAILFFYLLKFTFG